MRNLNRCWLALATAVALLMAPSCSDDSDDVINPPVEGVVEAGLNETLQTTVVPLFTFFGAMGQFLTASTAAVRGAFICPETSEWCASGEAICAPLGTRLAFDWDACVVVTGDAPLTVDGNLDVIPGTTISLTLTNLFLNDSPAMTGTGTINTSSCDYYVDIDTAGASVTGLITQCDSDPYPTGDSVGIRFDDFLITVVLDGSNVAQATATQGGTPVADCTIDLDSDPLTSSCDAP